MTVPNELEAGSNPFYEGRPGQKFRRCRESNRGRPAYNHILYCTNSDAILLPSFIEIVRYVRKFLAYVHIFTDVSGEIRAVASESELFVGVCGKHGRT